jgi:NADH:ubiquinone oxidoreductase subunit 5 (subunit L)/multisubunit Na+/H+ antiporter MnhA subunit
MDVSEQVDRGRWTRLVYLVLRIGDAGLLTGILALWGSTGTLEISPALEAVQFMPSETLNWVVGGLLLAVWVKVGGWPMHVWQQAGKLLSVFSRTWLYRILAPNLGLYLLYRITPLISGAPWVRAIALWGGALGAAWAAVLALVGWRLGQERALGGRLEATMVFLGAVQGGLALVLAALGLNTTVWLVLLALTPLSLLLSLAGHAAHYAPIFEGRWTASGLYGLGGLALLGFDVLIVWWARQAGVPLVPRLLVECAVGLTAAWAMVTTFDLWRGTGAERVQGRPTLGRWITLALLACGLLGAIVWRVPLLEHLADVSHGPAFAVPRLSEAAYLMATSPAGWIAVALGLWAQWRIKRGSRLPGLRRVEPESDAAQVAEHGIRLVARALRAGVEAGALGSALPGITKGVQALARFAHRWIEGVVLEGTTRQIARTTAHSGRLAYQVMEQGGLEGLLRRTVRAVLGASRWLQRRHTGRLRRNLVWVAASLVLAALALVLFVW